MSADKILPVPRKQRPSMEISVPGMYDRYDTEKKTTDELKTIIWWYFISYWNNRRICSANGRLPPMVKRQQYYNSLKGASIGYKILEENVSTNLDKIRTTTSSLFVR